MEPPLSLKPLTQALVLLDALPRHVLRSAVHFYQLQTPQPLKGGGTVSGSDPTLYEKLPQIEPAGEVHLELFECRRRPCSTQALIATQDLAQSSVPQGSANQLVDLLNFIRLGS